MFLMWGIMGMFGLSLHSDLNPSSGNLLLGCIFDAYSLWCHLLSEMLSNSFASFSYNYSWNVYISVINQGLDETGTSHSFFAYRDEVLTF